MPIDTPVPDVTAELFALILDDDDEPLCNVVKEEFGGCTRAARWAWRCAGCLHDSQACDEHRADFDRGCVEARAPSVRCHVCAGNTAVPLPWRPI